MNMQHFINENPFVTFLIVCVLVSGLITLVRGRAKNGEED